MAFKRIVVKVGTSTIAHATGLPNIRHMENLVKVLSDIKNTGRDIVLVTSGAIGVGAGKMGYQNLPKSVADRQACASVGQCALMKIYDNLFSEYNHMVSQILLTQNVMDGGEHQTNTVNTFNALLYKNILPIVNANDTISTKEIEFGDNDTLSATVATLIDADILVIMTDLDGMYDCNPRNNENAKLIDYIDNIDDKLKEAAKGEKSALGTGGMVTKLNAATIAAEKNIPTFIINGAHPERIYGIFDGKLKGTFIDLSKRFYDFKIN